MMNVMVRYFVGDTHRLWLHQLFYGFVDSLCNHIGISIIAFSSVLWSVIAQLIGMSVRKEDLCYLHHFKLSW
jgi:hypothetical protein